VTLDRARLHAMWPTYERLDAAFRLAPTTVTCADLLAGLPVARDRLDPDGLRWATARRLVRLERPLDLFDIDRGGTR
jgi:hypothetical protein